MITTVSSAAALNAALKTAQAGDTIKLTAGNYAGVVATGVTFGQDVTITSADPLHPATITDVKVAASSGLAFNNLTFQALTTGADTPFKVNDSQDIHFDHLSVHGSLDNNPQNDFSAFLIRTSSDVSVTNSEFQQLHHAIEHLDDNGLNFSGNLFHDIRTDGIRGGGSSNVTVSNNVFRDFHPVAGDHGDAIQFWTSNTTTSAHDITVTDNLFLRGSGGVAQGIFITDQVGNLPYLHVNISGNFIIGGMYNGIAVGDVHGLIIDHNVVAGFTDMNSWIRLEHVVGATVTNNSANQFLATVGDSNIVMNNDIITPRAADHGAAAYIQWQAQHPTGGPAMAVSAPDAVLSVVPAATADSVPGGLTSPPAAEPFVLPDPITIDVTHLASLHDISVGMFA